MLNTHMLIFTYAYFVNRKNLLSICYVIHYAKAMLEESSQNNSKKSIKELKEKIQEDFKKSIKEWLDKEHLSASWLADKLELSPGTVRNWFSTETRITEENIDKIGKIKKQYNSSFFNKLFDLNKNKPSTICIFPIEDESYEAWIASFNIRDINDILDYASKNEIKEYLNNSKKNLKDIPLGEIITHDELPTGQMYFEFSYASTYLWRKAAGINNQSLNLWANKILDNQAYTNIKKDIYDDNIF